MQEECTVHLCQLSFLLLGGACFVLIYCTDSCHCHLDASNALELMELLSSVGLACLKKAWCGKLPFKDLFLMCVCEPGKLHGLLYFLCQQEKTKEPSKCQTKYKYFFPLKIATSPQPENGTRKRLWSFSSSGKGLAFIFRLSRQYAMLGLHSSLDLGASDIDILNSRPRRRIKNRDAWRRWHKKGRKRALRSFFALLHSVKPQEFLPFPANGAYMPPLCPPPPPLTHFSLSCTRMRIARLPFPSSLPPSRLRRLCIGGRRQMV